MRAKPGRSSAGRKSPSGLNFTGAMAILCRDMTERVSELSHIDVSRVAFSFCQTRKAVQHGMYASLTPMRFEGGVRETVRGGRRYVIQQLLDEGGREMLYILSFYLPRFLDMSFQEKLTTVVHELYHIGPKFDGDLRRFGGRCYAHSGSQKNYDAFSEQLAKKWLAGEPSRDVYRFLEGTFRDQAKRHGRVYGTKIRTPKLLPVDSRRGGG